MVSKDGKIFFSRKCIEKGKFLKKNALALRNFDGAAESFLKEELPKVEARGHLRRIFAAGRKDGNGATAGDTRDKDHIDVKNNYCAPSGGSHGRPAMLLYGGRGGDPRTLGADPRTVGRGPRTHLY